MLISIFSRFFIFVILTLAGESSGLSRHPIVVLVAIDGFRYDYIDKGLTPALEELRRSGTSTKFMYNVFPTLTSPNMFSIATGLYPETHGVLANRVFNQNFKCLQNEDSVYELFHYNDDVIPLWSLNEISSRDRHSGTILWPGSQFIYQGKNVTYTAQNRSMSYRERVDTAIKWIVAPQQPANLIFLYFEQPDMTAHHYGPDSQEIENELRNINNITRYLMQKLADNNLVDKVNLIFLSDHGMVELPSTNYIDFDSYVKKEYFTVCGESPILFVKITPGYEQEIYENFTRASNDLGSFYVYKQSEIPESWHIKNSKRITDLLLVAKLSYGFADAKVYRGDHGYDFADQLRPFFIANGPLFKSNYTAMPFKNIDIYPLIAEVLHLHSPAEYLKPNGTLAEIRHIILRT